jgi:hypothetical protein
MRRTKKSVIRNRKAFTAGRQTRENVVSAVRSSKDAVTSTVASTWHVARDFARGLFVA